MRLRDRVSDSRIRLLGAEVWACPCDCEAVGIWWKGVSRTEVEEMNVKFLGRQVLQSFRIEIVESTLVGLR